MPDNLVYFSVIKSIAFTDLVRTFVPELTSYSREQLLKWLEEHTRVPLPIYSTRSYPEFCGASEYEDLHAAMEGTSPEMLFSMYHHHYATTLDNKFMVRNVGHLVKMGILNAPLFRAESVTVNAAGDGFSADTEYPLHWQIHPVSNFAAACPFIVLSVLSSRGPRKRIVPLTPQILAAGVVLPLQTAQAMVLAAKQAGPLPAAQPEVPPLVVQASPAMAVQASPVPEAPKYENPVHVGVAMIQVALGSRTHWLVVKRVEAPGFAKYAFPSGYQEKGERMVHCAIRELREELGETVFSFLDYHGAGDAKNWTFVGDAVNQKNICLDFYKFNLVLSEHQYSMLCKRFVANSEVSDIYAISGDSEAWAFPLHRAKALEAQPKPV